MAKIYPVRGSQTRFVTFIADGALLASKLQALNLKLARTTARYAIKEGAEVIRKAWEGTARGVNTTGRGEGHYADALTVTTRSRTMAGDVVGAPRMISGASAVISPSLTVPGVPDDEQPRRYAGVIEYGGRLGPRQGNSLIPAQFPARKAFEQSAEDAVDRVRDTLIAVLP